MQAQAGSYPCVWVREGTGGQGPCCAWLQPNRGAQLQAVLQACRHRDITQADRDCLLLCDRPRAWVRANAEQGKGRAERGGHAVVIRTRTRWSGGAPIPLALETTGRTTLA